VPRSRARLQLGVDLVREDLLVLADEDLRDRARRRLLVLGEVRGVVASIASCVVVAFFVIAL
jgi:hypothetical protein